MEILRRICIGAACPLFALLIIVVPVAAVTMITGPTVITEPGEYRLANDIVNSNAPVCIDVRVDSVTIDGRGHLIDGMGSSGSVGIRVQWTRSDAPDTIIRNLRFTDWGSGVDLYKAVHPNVLYCTFRNNVVGVNGYCVNDVEVGSCTFVGNGDGVSLAGTSDAVIRYCSFTRNTFGIALGRILASSGITLRSNRIEGSGNTGILIGLGTGPVTIESNRITNSGRVGLSLNDRPGHTVTNNLFNNRNNAEVAAPVANTWSFQPKRGTNIVGGYRLGGNYWAKPDGTGFSQVTPDRNHDGFCDAPYTVAPMNIDYYPLKANR